MIKSITFKLWLALASTLFLSLGALLGLTHYSVNKQFLAFSFRSLQEQLPPLENSIIETYQRQSSLQPFVQNPRLWRKLLYRNLPFTRPPRHAHTPDLPPSLQLNELHQNQKHFAQSLALYDNAKAFIAGNAKLGPSTVWHEVLIEDNTIAYIAFDKPGKILRHSEMLFMQQQIKSFIIVATATVLFSLLIALLISKRLVSPVSLLSRNARKVTQGEFDARINSTSKDELGELCRNFDEMSEKLEANEFARKQWVADISHEMRTPLAILRAQIEAMQDGIRPTNPSNLGLLGDKISDLNHLINDLFELSLSDAGALQLEFQEINISHFLEKYVNGISTRATKSGFELTWEIPTRIQAVVWADERRIRQVLDNVFENSLRYSNAPGAFRWSLSETSNNVNINIDDCPPTVENDKLKQIFSRLYRLESSRNRATGGAGIGLSLCENLINAHKGKISAHASPLGGLRITIKLPKHTA